MGNVSSIKKFFALIITIVAFVIFSILGCVSVYQFVNMTESNVFDLLDSEANSEANKLYGNFIAAANKTESLAQTLEAVNNYDAEVVQKTINLYITNEPLLFGGGIWLEPFIYDGAHKYYAPYVYKTDNGNCIFMWGNNDSEYEYFSTDWYKDVFKPGARAAWSSLHFAGVTNQEVITCISPIRRGGSVIGAATIDIGVRELVDDVKAIRVGKEGYAFMRDKNGLKIGEAGAQPSADNAQDSRLFQQNAKKQLVTGKIDNRDVYSLAAPIGNTGLELVMVLPASEFVMPIWKIIIFNVILLAAAVTLFTVLILYLFERKIGRPIRHLAVAAARIGIGDLDNVIRPEANDEIGHLAVSFEHMRSRIASLLTKINDKNTQLLCAYDVTIRAFYKAIEQRESNTAEHSLEVNAIALKIGQKLGLKEDQMRHLNWGTLLHDLGKLAIDDSILLKPGPLDDEEYLLIKKHPEVGYNILIESDFLKETAEVALYHQEKFDGSGYPYGLKGENIPLLARICSVADAFQAMIADRPYRMGMSAEEAARELTRCRGKHFDPRIVDAFLSLDFMELKRRAV